MVVGLPYRPKLAGNGGEARLALLAFQRLQQRGFLAADVGAVAMVRMQLEVEARAQDVVAQKPAARLFERLLEDLVFVQISPWM